MSETTPAPTALTWVVPARLGPGARDALAGCLECVFADEPTPRPHMEVAPGVEVVVHPGPDEFTIRATVPVAEPPTQLTWLDEWVRRALDLCGLPDAGPVEVRALS